MQFCNYKPMLPNYKSMLQVHKGKNHTSRLRRKVVEEGWSKGVSLQWLELTSSLKKKWCNGVARYTLLRWAVNQGDDVWLAHRGTRHQQKCNHCSSRGDTFPSGHTMPPMCELCIQTLFFLPCRARHDSSDGRSTSHTTSHTTGVISRPWGIQTKKAKQTPPKQTKPKTTKNTNTTKGPPAVRR